MRTSAAVCDLREASPAVRLVQSVVEAVRLPVTVKMRLGWDATQLTAPRFAREFEQVGVVAVAIHGRTREQGFSGTVDRSGIRRVVEAVERIPVIGNGDIRSVEDAQIMFAETGCHGISVGRGALANPWIFRQLVQHELTGRYDPPGIVRRSARAAAAAISSISANCIRSGGPSSCFARWATGI